jgi:hypothetical protein
LGRTWADDNEVGDPLGGGVDNFTFRSPLFAYQFCTRKVATSFLEDILRSSDFCLLHLFASMRWEFWASQEALTLPFYFALWPTINHVNYPDIKRIGAKHGGNGFMHLFNIGTIQTTKDSHGIPPMVIIAR